MPRVGPGYRRRMRIAVLGPLEVRPTTARPWPCRARRNACCWPCWPPAHRTWSAPTASSRRCGTATARSPPASRCRCTWCGCAPRSSPTGRTGSTGRYVVRRGTGYALALDRADVDALRSRDLAARGRALLAAGRPRRGGPAAAPPPLGLWRGEPYADWPDAPFAEAERRRLAEVRGGRRHRRCWRRGSRSASTPRCCPELERLVAEDPLQEEWWRLLVLALYRAAGRATPWPPRRRARRVLAEELGADPGPRLRAVEAAVLAQDPRARPARAAPPPPPAGRRTVAGLPVQGAGRLPGGRRRAVPRPRPAGQPPGRPAGRRAAARRLRAQRRREVLASSGPGSSRRSPAGALPGSDGVAAVVVTPGRRPVDALAELTGETPPERAGPAGLRPVRGAVGARRRPRRADRLPRHRAGAARRRRSSPAASPWCAATTSAGWPSTPAFTERLGAALVLVPPLTDDELREVVREPAAAVGLDVGARPARRRGGRRAGPGRRAAAALHRAGRHLGTAPRRPADPRRLPRGRRRRGRADPVGRGRVRRPGRRGPGVGAPAAGAAGRHRRRRGAGPPAAARSPSWIWTATGPRGGRWSRSSSAGGCSRSTASASTSRTRRCSPRGRGWPAGSRTTPPAGPCAGTWPPRPGSGSAAAEPDDELYRGARLAAALDWAADADGGRDARGAAVPRRLAGARRRRADRGARPGRPRGGRRGGPGAWPPGWPRSSSWPSSRPAWRCARAAVGRAPRPPRSSARSPTPTGWRRCSTTAGSPRPVLCSRPRAAAWPTPRDPGRAARRPGRAPARGARRPFTGDLLGGRRSRTTAADPVHRGGTADPVGGTSASGSSPARLVGPGARTRGTGWRSASASPTDGRTVHAGRRRTAPVGPAGRRGRRAIRFRAARSSAGRRSAAASRRTAELLDVLVAARRATWQAARRPGGWSQSTRPTGSRVTPGSPARCRRRDDEAGGRTSRTDGRSRGRLEQPTRTATLVDLATGSRPWSRLAAPGRRRITAYRALSSGRRGASGTTAP